MEVWDVCQALRWSRHTWGKGVRAVPRLCIDYLGFCLTTEKKLRKNLSQGKRRVLGWSAQNAIHLVDLAIADDGLDWPAVPCRPWLSCQATTSTLVQRKYLPICRNTRFAHQITLSQRNRSVPWYSRQTVECRDPRVSACYLRTRGHQHRGEDPWFVKPLASGHGFGSGTTNYPRKAGFPYISHPNTNMKLQHRKFLVYSTYRQMVRCTEIAFSARQNAENELQQNT